MSNTHRNVSVIGAAWGLGAPNPGCGDGPDVLKSIGLVQAIGAQRAHVGWLGTVHADSKGSLDSQIARACSTLADVVTGVVARGDLALVVGGDHTCAVGTWTGAADAVAGDAAGDGGPLGLLWIDAHLDSHVPSTSPSNALHGMPLACLLGRGETPLCAGRAVVRPEHVCVVGARSFEPAEAELLMRLGVRVFPMAEIERRGLDAVVREALRLVRTGTARFGITLDLDALDPRDAPGVGVPEPGGLRAAELAAALHGIASDPALCALEVVEYDPSLDVAGRTVASLRAIVDAAFAPRCGAQPLMRLEHDYGAHNYAPLPVVLSRGRGVHVWDIDGRRYLDMMSAYSAVSLGHGHPRIVGALVDQSHRLSVTSRAYFNDRLPPFLQRLCELAGYDRALPVNTGLEAVETALKAARKWGHKVKGIPEPEAEIIACQGNFHGRSIAIVGLSSEPQYREGFGPFPSGYRIVPYGDVDALRAAITPRTAAFLVEPIQGEAGIVMPPPGYLAECARICRENDVLLICDEVQTGLGRTGRMFACEHEGVRPDGLILGKALGGGVLPVSAFLADAAVMDVFTPGDHGSTFGGNPLGAAVALETLSVLEDEGLVGRSAELGARLLDHLTAMRSSVVRDVRGRGLFIGVEVDPRQADARTLCRRLLAMGILSKDTHETVLRFVPPLVIGADEIDWAAERIRRVFETAPAPARRAATAA